MILAYKVRMYRQARRYLERCDQATRKRLAVRIDQLASAPYKRSKPLTGYEGGRSSRVGDWRIIFEPDEEARVIHVRAIRGRGDVYDRI